jgi:hypothetical protein
LAPSLNRRAVEELPGMLYGFFVSLAGDDLGRDCDVALAVHFVDAVFVHGSVSKSEGEISRSEL